MVYKLHLLEVGELWNCDEYINYTLQILYEWLNMITCKCVLVWHNLWKISSSIKHYHNKEFNVVWIALMTWRVGSKKILFPHFCEKICWKNIYPIFGINRIEVGLQKSNSNGSRSCFPVSNYIHVLHLF